MFVPRERDGKIENSWYDRSVTPIRVRDGAVAGVYQVWIERTTEVLAARRLQTLSRLAAATAGRDRREALRSALAVLGKAADVPFAAAYLLDASNERVSLAGAVGIADDGTMAPAVLRLAPGGGWPLYQAVDQRHLVLVDDVAARFRGQLVGSEQLVPECAVLCPLRDEAEDRVIGVLVLGAHPRLPFDDRYREFLALAGEMVSARVAESCARQRERQRLERLAELDRAKTEFFSNVSHEFRTPLTLLLAPLEEIVRRSPELPPGMAAEVELVQRSARRLLRLVGTLLDLSQAEAGRLRARFAPTDLAGLSAEVASVFRSAAEAAGLKLAIGAPLLPEPVWVDAGMWEKIVSNLVSNALKFTWEGGHKISNTRWRTPSPRTRQHAKMAPEPKPLSSRLHRPAVAVIDPCLPGLIVRRSSADRLQNYLTHRPSGAPARPFSMPACGVIHDHPVHKWRPACACTITSPARSPR